jgi:hypothetical protein
LKCAIGSQGKGRESERVERTRFVPIREAGKGKG